MEVPGRKTSRDQKLASDQDDPVYCQPCGKTGKHIRAKSHCSDCQEDLCKQCCDYHKQLKVLESHKLTDISDGKDTTRRKQGSVPTIICRVHTDELIKFYCRIHKVTACAACAVQNHVTCKPEYIPDISLGYKDGSDYTQLNTDIDTLLKKVTGFLKCTEENIKKTDDNGRDLVSEIRKCRQELNQYLDKKEKELIQETEKRRQNDIKSLHQIRDDCKTMSQQMSDTKTNLRKMEKQSSDLLIACTDTATKMNEMKDRMDKYDKTSKPFIYQFTKSEFSISLGSSRCPIGSITKVEQSKQDSKPKRGNRNLQNVNVDTKVMSTADWEHCQFEVERDLIIKCAQDEIGSTITGLALLRPNVLLVADYENMCVKRVNINTGAINAYLRLPSGPWDITILGLDQAAVTLPNIRKIQFISTSSELSLLHVTTVDGECHGICSTTDDKLIVSFIEPGKVEVLNINGSVLCTISTDARGKSLFSYPFYLTVVTENDQEVIYVSDQDTDTLTKLTMTGQVLLTYRDKDLKCPQGLTSPDDGQLLVCGCGSDNVQLVSRNGKKVRTLLFEDGVVRPQIICYDASMRTLCVASYYRSEIKVYRVK